jgi:N-formylmaleamate deformylase
MAKLFYGHVLSNGLSIHYYRTGDLKPPVVLLHGITDNGMCWGNLSLSLEPDYDVVMIDARGHGLSDAPENGYASHIQAQDVAEVIRQLELRKPAVIGHSMGADTAANVAALYPDLVSCVVLEDPPWFAVDRSASQAEEMEAQNRANIERMRSLSLNDLILECKQKHPFWEETEQFHWAKAKQQVKANVAAFHGEARRPWREVAARISCPVLLLTADLAAGALVTPELAKEAGKFWRKSSVVYIPEAGHNVRRDQFDLYWDTIAHFLAKVPRK